MVRSNMKKNGNDNVIMRCIATVIVAVMLFQDIVWANPALSSLRSDDSRNTTLQIKTIFTDPANFSRAIAPLLEKTVETLIASRDHLTLKDIESALTICDRQNAESLTPRNYSWEVDSSGNQIIIQFKDFKGVAYYQVRYYYWHPDGAYQAAIKESLTPPLWSDPGVRDSEINSYLRKQVKVFVPKVFRPIEPIMDDPQAVVQERQRLAGQRREHNEYASPIPPYEPGDEHAFVARLSGPGNPQARARRRSVDRVETPRLGTRRGGRSISSKAGRDGRNRTPGIKRQWMLEGAGLRGPGKSFPPKDKKEAWTDSMLKALKGKLDIGNKIKNLPTLLSIDTGFYMTHQGKNSPRAIYQRYSEAWRAKVFRLDEGAFIHHYILLDLGFITPDLWQEYLDYQRSPKPFASPALKREWRDKIRPFLKGKLNSKKQIKDADTLRDITRALYSDNVKEGLDKIYMAYYRAKGRGQITIDEGSILVHFVLKDVGLVDAKVWKRYLENPFPSDRDRVDWTDTVKKALMKARTATGKRYLNRQGQFAKTYVFSSLEYTFFKRSTKLWRIFDRYHAASQDGRIKDVPEGVTVHHYLLNDLGFVSPKTWTEHCSGNYFTEGQKAAWCKRLKAFLKKKKKLSGKFKVKDLKALLTITVPLLREDDNVYEIYKAYTTGLSSGLIHKPLYPSRLAFILRDLKFVTPRLWREYRQYVTGPRRFPKLELEDIWRAHIADALREEGKLGRDGIIDSLPALESLRSEMFTSRGGEQGPENICHEYGQYHKAHNFPKRLYAYLYMLYDLELVSPDVWTEFLDQHGLEMPEKKAYAKPGYGRRINGLVCASAVGKVTIIKNLGIDDDVLDDWCSEVYPPGEKYIEALAALLKAKKEYVLFGEKPPKLGNYALGKSYGLRIKEARKKQGYSISYLAMKSGIPEETIRYLESSRKIVLPSIKVFNRLAGALGVSTEYILTGEDEPVWTVFGITKGYGNRLKTVITLAAVTVQELSKLTAIGRKRIEAYCNNSVSQPDFEEMELFADKLLVPVDYLRNGSKKQDALNMARLRPGYGDRIRKLRIAKALTMDELTTLIEKRRRRAALSGDLEDWEKETAYPSEKEVKALARVLKVDPGYIMRGENPPDWTTYGVTDGYGDRIKVARLKQGFSIETLSKQTEIPEKTLKALEKGDRNKVLPGPALMKPIHKALTIPLGYLERGEKVPRWKRFGIVVYYGNRLWRAMFARQMDIERLNEATGITARRIKQFLNNDVKNPKHEEFVSFASVLRMPIEYIKSGKREPRWTKIMRIFTRFGERIERLRIKMALTQGELAELVGVDADMIDAWEKEEIFPNARDINMLEKHLRCNKEYILKGKRPPNWMKYGVTAGYERRLKEARIAQGYLSIEFFADLVKLPVETIEKLETGNRDILLPGPALLTQIADNGGIPYYFLMQNDRKDLLYKSPITRGYGKRIREAFKMFDVTITAVAKETGLLKTQLLSYIKEKVKVPDHEVFLKIAQAPSLCGTNDEDEGEIESETESEMGPKYNGEDLVLYLKDGAVKPDWDRWTYLSTGYGERIKKVRERKPMTTFELAHRVKKDEYDINLWERELERPSKSNIANLAKALGVEESYIAKGVNPPDWDNYGITDGYGDRINMLAKKQGFSLAYIISLKIPGITKTVLKNLLRERRDLVLPRPALLKSLADILGVSLNYLAQGKSEDAPDWERFGIRSGYGKRMERVIAARGLNMAELVALFKLEEPQINSWLACKITDVKHRDMDRFSRALDVDIEYLKNGSNPPDWEQITRITKGYDRRITKQRLKKGLTKAGLALKIGVSEDVVKAWENEKLYPINKEAGDMAKVFEVSERYILLGFAHFRGSRKKSSKEISIVYNSPLAKVVALKGINMSNLEEMFGMPEEDIQQYLDGDVEDPKEEDYEKFAEKLEVTNEYLMTGKNPPDWAGITRITPGYGDRIENLRGLNVLTQEELAELVETDVETLNAWEEESLYPTNEEVGKLALELYVSPEYILLGKNKPDFADYGLHPGYGGRIMRLREEQGYTTAFLAEKADMDEEDILALEGEDREKIPPEDHVLAKVIVALEVKNIMSGLAYVKRGTKTIYWGQFGFIAGYRQRLRKAMDEMKMSVPRLSFLSGVPKGRIFHYLEGAIKQPQDDDIVAFALALCVPGVEVETVIGYIKKKDPVIQWEEVDTPVQLARRKADKKRENALRERVEAAKRVARARRRSLDGFDGEEEIRPLRESLAGDSELSEVALSTGLLHLEDMPAVVREQLLIIFGEYRSIKEAIKENAMHLKRIWAKLNRNNVEEREDEEDKDAGEGEGEKTEDEATDEDAKSQSEGWVEVFSEEVRLDLDHPGLCLEIKERKGFRPQAREMQARLDKFNAARLGGAWEAIKSDREKARSPNASAEKNALENFLIDGFTVVCVSLESNIASEAAKIRAKGKVTEPEKREIKARLSQAWQAELMELLLKMPDGSSKIFKTDILRMRAQLTHRVNKFMRKVNSGTIFNNGPGAKGAYCEPGSDSLPSLAELTSEEAGYNELVSIPAQDENFLKLITLVGHIHLLGNDARVIVNGLLDNMFTDTYTRASRKLRETFGYMLGLAVNHEEYRLFLYYVLNNKANINHFAQHIVFATSPMLPIDSARYYDQDNKKVIIVFNDNFFNIDVAVPSDANSQAAAFHIRMERIMHELAHDNFITDRNSEIDEEVGIIQEVDIPLYKFTCNIKLGTQTVQETITDLYSQGSVKDLMHGSGRLFGKIPGWLEQNAKGDIQLFLSIWRYVTDNMPEQTIQAKAFGSNRSIRLKNSVRSKVEDNITEHMPFFVNDLISWAKSAPIEEEQERQGLVLLLDLPDMNSRQAKDLVTDNIIEPLKRHKENNPYLKDVLSNLTIDDGNRIGVYERRMEIGSLDSKNVIIVTTEARVERFSKFKDAYITALGLPVREFDWKKCYCPYLESIMFAVARAIGKDRNILLELYNSIPGVQKLDMVKFIDNFFSGDTALKQIVLRLESINEFNHEDLLAVYEGIRKHITRA